MRIVYQPAAASVPIHRSLPRLMARLLSLFLVLALILGQGTAMASSVCRHQNAAEHAMAKRSHDRRIAAVSLWEEAAAAAAAKKGSNTADAGSHWPSDMLPAQTAGTPPSPGTAVHPRPARQAALASGSLVPLLKPPSL